MLLNKPVAVTHKIHAIRIPTDFKNSIELCQTIFVLFVLWETDNINRTLNGDVFVFVSCAFEMHLFNVCVCSR